MDGEFGLVDSFGVDNGELDEFEKHVCFVLGVEWQNVVSTTDSIKDRELNFTVHAANKVRLEAALNRRGRPYSWKYPHDDVSEEWVYLTVLEEM